MDEIKDCAIRPWMPVFLILENIFKRYDCLLQFFLEVQRHGAVGFQYARPGV